MNKQDTTANREWLESLIVKGASLDQNRSAVLVAIDGRFPGERNMRRRDDLTALFDTMIDEDFARVMREDADRNAPSLCECL